MGAVAEFSEAKIEIAGTEHRIEHSFIKYLDGEDSVCSEEIVSAISFLAIADPSRLDSMSRIDAASCSFERLSDGLTMALHHFGVPAAIGWTAAGKFMVDATGVDIWPEYLEQVDIMRKFNRRLKEDILPAITGFSGIWTRRFISRGTMADLDDILRDMAGVNCRLAAYLVKIVAVSVRKLKEPSGGDELGRKTLDIL